MLSEDDFLEDVAFDEAERRRRILQDIAAQVRQHGVHFAALGHPLLGDALYGGDASLLARPALHSAAADLTQPVTGQLLHITAPVPDDLRVFGFERYL